MKRSIVLFIRGSKIYNSRSVTSLATETIPRKSSFRILHSEDADAFSAYFPRIVEDIVDQQLISTEPTVNYRLRKVLNYNIPGGKHVTPHILIYCYKLMEHGHNNLTSQKNDLVNKLAWCWETMNSMLLMIDDIIDGAEMRRGKKTWYKLDGVQALCDILLLSSCYSKLLEKYFSKHLNFKQIVDVFNKAKITATVGETLQFELRDFESFTVSNFRKIAKYKTVPIRFEAPFRLACLLSNQKGFLDDPNCQNILTELGILYQIQNDFYDCYGAALLGKVGNDIEENLCTILIALASQKANTLQKRTLEECYGYYDTEKVKKVKEIYRQLELEHCYNELEYRSCKYICDELAKIEHDPKRNLMKNLASLIFGENKHHILRS